jgi:pimeloyl-ACP methyl ester carboxylesterase
MLKAEGLEYELHGEGEPVLLVHGSHVADAFLPLTREAVLAGRYCLVRYRRRGFGGSDPHTGPFGIEGQARDGAVTAVQLANEAPHTVHSLVLLEPPLGTADGSSATSEILSPLVAMYRSGDPRGALAAFMGIVGGPDWRTEVARTVPGGPEQGEKDVATFFEVEVPALQAWSFEEDKASRISQPVLYIIGSESGPLFERPKQFFQSLVPQTEEVVLPGLNHLLQMRNSSLVAAPIADFLARHPF